MKKHLLMISAILLVSVAPGAVAQELAPPCCNLGDANGVGGVTTFDLVLITQHLLGITCMDEVTQCNVDVDGDGAVTEQDVELIQSYILGRISTFPRCGDLDGDGQLEWFSGGDDLDQTAGCAGPVTDGCENADANNDGVVNSTDVFTFIDHANGLVNSFPGCACGEGACAAPE